jgi:hypothetical protein
MRPATIMSITDAIEHAITDATSLAVSMYSSSRPLSEVTIGRVLRSILAAQLNGRFDRPVAALRVEFSQSGA